MAKINSRKDAAVSFLNLIIAGKIHEAYTAYVAEGMRHHNIMFKGDAASLEVAMQESHTIYPKKIFNVKHVLEDGDFVVVHAHVRFKAAEPGFALVHIFLFEGNYIKEIWDIGQAIPENSPNENGMF